MRAQLETKTTNFGITASKIKTTLNPIVIAYLVVLGISAIALGINAFYFHYIGNSYFPADSLLVGILLLVTLTGTYLQYQREHATFLLVREILFFYLIMSGLVIITNSAQFTPFKPIDQFIIRLESPLGINMAQIVAWTAHHPLFKTTLNFAYTSLEYQMALLPLFIIFSLNWQRLRAYYFLLLVSALIGFSFYYFFPTTAPASNVHGAFFYKEQYATGIKFNEIHQLLTPTTIDGGMVSFPSFHMIWAILCLYLVYEYRLVFFILLPINCLLILSCVLLGWHYPSDLIGSAAVLIVSYWLTKRSSNTFLLEHK